jgi:hypothetical protein
MGKINEFCAGIDVGKRFLLCCALTGAAQEEPRSQTRRFDATVQDLVHLRLTSRRTSTERFPRELRA